MDSIDKNKNFLRYEKLKINKNHFIKFRQQRHYMVHLSQTSKVNHHTQPFAYQWDTLVRKHFNKYQNLIDAQTYQLQRTQRLFFSLSYPRFYNSDLVVLNLLRKKQTVGQVTQDQLDLYKNINPCIASDYNRTFNHNLPIPKLGLLVGGGLFGYATVFNFTIPARAMLLAVPLAIDFLRLSSDALVQSRSSEFLDWVVGYRKAKAWAERYRTVFHNQQTSKVIGHNNLNDLGRQLIAMAQGQK